MPDYMVRLKHEASAYLAGCLHLCRVETVEEGERLARETPGGILSAIGVRKLPELVVHIGNRKIDLFTRVLPVVNSLAICEQLGIRPS